MYQSYTTSATRQLHTLLPGPNGKQACLTLYDECPHITHRICSHSRPRDPYLHCDLPPLPPTTSPRTIEYINKDNRHTIETTHSSLSPLYLPPETPMTKSLARLVLSKHSPVMRHIRDSAAPAPTIPTIYILTFSTDRTPTTLAFASLLNTHLPPRIRLLYTIDARTFLVPPKRICETYSGVAHAVQDEVLRDVRARREIDCAVYELVEFVARGGRETSLAVCCTAGTHRSVAVAEMIALGVRERVRAMGRGEGVKIVVRHVHRVKGGGDPY